MKAPTIRFFGAVGTVTGSRFLIEGSRSNILIDAGLFQGLKELRLKNWDPFPFDPAKIDAIVLSHAHLDHCGYLPRLISQGFTGKIYMTHYTTRLASIVLRDSAILQMEDAKYALKKGYSKHKNPKPLYDASDVENTIPHFTGVPFGEVIDIAEGAKVTFHRSGHILGSSHLLIEIDGKKIAFSGDLGRPHHTLLAPPDPLPPRGLDAIVIESTYGDRTHPEISTSFADVINKTVKRGGSILIPAFAIDRTEIMLMTIKKLMREQKIPRIPVCVDSPMALATLAEYRSAIASRSLEIRSSVLDLGEDPFDIGTLFEANTVEQSKSLNQPSEPSIIISASGMATGGRVVHHLEMMLPDSKNTVLLVGYQAAGTRGQLLLAGSKELKMFGKYVPVNAEIDQINEFSVHADSEELIQWLGGTEKPSEIFVVHGEKDSAITFAKKIADKLNWDVVVPQPEDAYQI